VAVAGSKINEQHEDNPEAAKKLPLQIPRRARHFLGREALIEDLSRAIMPGGVVTVYGSAGTGKTAVAVEFMRRLQESGELLQRFPDGLIYYDFHRRPLAVSALEFVLHSLGHERLGSLYKNALSSLAGKQLLLVLDGAEEAHDLAGMISFAPSCGVLIASSRREDVLDKGFSLKGLDAANGQKVLAAWAGDRAAAEEIRTEICDQVGNLPLALPLVGQFLTASELAATAYAEWLDLRGLTAQDFSDHPQASIARLLEKSLAHAGEGARQALAIVGLLAPMPFQAEAAAAALGRPLSETRQALDVLVNFGLLERLDSGYVS
jgi:hypothetical protein